jgi:uncharacterized membrane protein
LLWELDRHSLWLDEMATVEALQGSMNDVITWCLRDIHPPLYYIGLKLWVVAAGTSDVSLRLFSAVAALLSVALAGPVARRFVGDAAAPPATLLLGLHPALVEFGRMARYYSLTVLLSLVSALALHRALERGRAREWALYVVSMVAAVYTFYPTGFLIAAHVPSASSHRLPLSRSQRNATGKTRLPAPPRGRGLSTIAVIGTSERSALAATLAQTWDISGAKQGPGTLSDGV